ncbi:nucleoside hydrolase-like domain-containing protein [Fibrella arboris]|uniref:nucleoside hydrolase-like domain-containing protein n=1 Tax=Fibrella arboris TaxID=3242486 RepID=UPI00352109AE
MTPLSIKRCLTLLSIFSSLSLVAQPKPNVPERLRVLVLTDIEADPDDSQSLVRLLTYANQWDIEGLIATTSIHQKTRVAPETIQALVAAYGKVQPNLLKHEPGYPTAQTLAAKIRKGLPVYGMAGVGEGHDSEGSNWIIKALEKPDERPLWVSVWGGPNTLAQALWTIRKTYPADKAEKLYRKLRVYTVSDQDDSGPWIRKTFPGIFFICSPGYGYEQATWRGINTTEAGTHAELISNEWLAKHIQQGHGPMGALYPDVAYGMEGDTPTFLGLIPNGLNVPEHPDYGGWGGRYTLYQPTTLPPRGRFARPDFPADEPETRPIWTNAADSVYTDALPRRSYAEPADRPGAKSIFATIWRWRADFQHDFAARMDWCTKSYAEANHPPKPALAHPDNLTVHSGELFHLNAAGTTDPDGDSMSYLWYHYPEAGTYPGRISFRPYASNLYDLPVMAPTVTAPQTIQFILKVTDKGTPALTRYKRVIVHVLPN